MSTAMAEEKPKEKEGFFSRTSLGRLFSGKKKEGKPELKHASMGATTTTSKEQQHAAAMADISRKSALVKNSMNASRPTKSTDLMGDLADDFMRLKDEKHSEGAKAGAKKGEVWD